MRFEYLLVSNAPLFSNKPIMPDVDISWEPCNRCIYGKFFPFGTLIFYMLNSISSQSNMSTSMFLFKEIRTRNYRTEKNFQGKSLTCQQNSFLWKNSSVMILLLKQLEPIGAIVRYTKPLLYIFVSVCIFIEWTRTYSSGNNSLLLFCVVLLAVYGF